MRHCLRPDATLFGWAGAPALSEGYERLIAKVPA